MAALHGQHDSSYFFALPRARLRPVSLLVRIERRDHGNEGVHLSSAQYPDNGCIHSHRFQAGRGLLVTCQKDADRSLIILNRRYLCSQPHTKSSISSPSDSSACSSPSANATTRRGAVAQLLLLTSATWTCQLASSGGLELSQARADDAVGEPSAVAGNPTATKEASPLQNLLSAFDSYEETKSGKKLPKAYLKSVREVVRTLRESLLEETSEGSKFRRASEPAKEAIREYLGAWKGASTVVAEESYVQVEAALRELSAFYSKRGPRAAMPQEVKDRLLALLDKAQDSL